MKDLATKIKKSFKDAKKASVISTGADMKTPKDESDFVVMPEWWQKATGLMGLPFGYVFMISGNSDSGKTSCGIEAIKKAQEQGYYAILIDTEKKTTQDRFIKRGIDPDQLALIRPDYLEEAYDSVDKYVDAIKASDPESKILIVFDSLGNTPARAEALTDVDDSLQMGLAAKVNKRGLRRLVPRLNKDDIHLLLINQTYNNMGSPGRTNAGGNAGDFFSALTFQTSRFKWLEKKVKGEDIRVGARVQWTLYKNHLFTEVPLYKKTLIDCTAEGMSLVGTKKDKDAEDE